MVGEPSDVCDGTGSYCPFEDRVGFGEEDEVEGGENEDEVWRWRERCRCG